MDEDLTDPEIMKRILNGFNQSTLDPVGPVGSQDQHMRVLGELKELEQNIREGLPKVTVDKRMTLT